MSREHFTDEGEAPKKPQFIIPEGGDYPKRYLKKKLRCSVCGKDVRHKRAHFGIDWDAGNELAGRKCVECGNVLVVFEVILAGRGRL